MATHPRVSVNAASTPTSTLEEDLAFWKSLGLRQVGLHRRKLAAAGWERGVELVRASGFGVTTVVHSDMFDLTRPETWERDQEQLAIAIDAAAAVGARSVYGTTGRYGTLTWEEAAEAFGEAIGPALQQARRLGLQLGLEPTNPLVPHSFLHSLDDGIALAAHTGLDLCVDTFWCARERDLRNRLARALPHMCLLQVSGAADIPSVFERAVPGEGVVDVARPLDWLLEAGYDGPVEIEVMGAGPREEGYERAVARSVDWLSEHLIEAGA